MPDHEDADQQQRPLVNLTSGYGQQTAMFAPRFAEMGHDVAISCFYGLEGGCIEWQGMRCYPTDQTRFGLHRLAEYATHHGEGDRSDVLVFTLQDVWPLLQGVPNFKDLRFACWTPIDHDPAPPMVVEFLKTVRPHVIAMTRHGQSALAREGIDADYVPHGVQTDVFRPEPHLRGEYRAQLKIPEDAFVIGMVAMNQGLPPRKSFPQVFRAFAEFSRKHSDAILYLHSEVHGLNNGVNLVALADHCGIDADKLRTSDQAMMHLGIPQPLLNGLYNCFDVLALPSHGEGFGIPLVEAQSCGVPVITTDWTAMTELCGAGWLLDGELWYDGTQRSDYKLPHHNEILDAFEQAYEHARDWKIRETAREFALQYDVEAVTELWKPILTELEQPREVAPLRLAA